MLAEDWTCTTDDEDEEEEQAEEEDRGTSTDARKALSLSSLRPLSPPPPVLLPLFPAPWSWPLLLGPALASGSASLLLSPLPLVVRNLYSVRAWCLRCG